MARRSDQHLAQAERPPAPRVDRPVVPSYLLILLAFTLAAMFIVDRDLVPTMAVLAAIWLVISLVLRPGYHWAGTGAVLSLTLTLAVRNYSDLEPAGRIWGAVALAIVASPYILQPLRDSSGFPFLHFWCLIVGIYTYIDVFFAKPSIRYADIYPNEVRTEGFRTLALFAAVLVATGMGALLLVRLRSAKPRRAPTAVLGPRSTVRAYALAVGSAAALVVARLTGADSALGSLTGLVQLLMFGGWLVLVYAWMTGELRIIHRIVVLLVPAAWVLAILGESALYQAAYPGFFVLGLWVALRRTIPWLPIVIAVTLLIVMNSGKGEFRQDVRKGEVQGSTTSLGITWLSQTGSSLSETTEDQLTQSALRFANSALLGYVATWVPDRYPYFGYEAYTSLPDVLLPRILSPGKPAFNNANKFGREYDLISRSDYETTVNTPLQVEAMVAGGYGALVVVAIATGLWLALLSRIFSSRSATALITASLLSLQIVQATESGVLGMILVVPYGLVVYPVIWWVVGVPTRRAGAHAEAPPRRDASARSSSGVTSDTNPRPGPGAAIDAASR